MIQMPPRDTKTEGDGFEKAVSSGPRAVDASDSSPRKRGTTSGDHPDVEHEKRFSRRQVVQGLSAGGVVGIAGCLGSGDDGEGDGGGRDDGADDGRASDDETDSEEVDDEDSNGTDDDGDDADDGADDASEADGEDDGNTTAEITFQGETHTAGGFRVMCGGAGVSDVHHFDASFETPDLDVGLRLFTSFYDDYADINVHKEVEEVEDFFADDYDMEEDSEHYHADVGYDEVEFDVDGEENHASGMAQLEPNNELAEEANPDGVEVEFEIRC